MNIQFTIGGPETNCVFGVDFKDLTEHLKSSADQKYGLGNMDSQILIDITRDNHHYYFNIFAGKSETIFSVKNKIIDELILIDGITYQQYDEKNNINISITTT